MSAPQPGYDSARTAKVFAEVAERSGRLVGEFLQRQAEGKGLAYTDEFGIARAFMDLSARMLADPWKPAEAQTKMFWDYVALWQTSVLKMLGQKTKPIAEPAKGDNRFRDEDWQNNFLFDHIKQSYLIAARNAHDAVSAVEGLPEETRRKVDFFTRQYIDALSPSNFALTNPQVLRETVQSGGQNLIRGLNNLLADIERGDGQLRIRMTDENAFKLGVNAATTPGKAVFQTALMQLIQYQPATTEVFRQPLLIVPPWINKYYILDLREKNSFVRWAVNQGHTVFVVSWVNPDARYAEKTFEDYMFEGTLAALEAIERATGEHRISLIGYCLARGVGAHRRHHQSPFGEQIRLLDSVASARNGRGVAGQGGVERRFVVDRLAHLDRRPERTRPGAGANPGCGRAASSRRRSGVLRQRSRRHSGIVEAPVISRRPVQRCSARGSRCERRGPPGRAACPRRRRALSPLRSRNLLTRLAWRANEQPVEEPARQMAKNERNERHLPGNDGEAAFLRVSEPAPSIPREGDHIHGCEASPRRVSPRDPAPDGSQCRGAD